MKLTAGAKIVIGVILALLIFWLGQNWGTFDFSSKPKVDDLANCHETYTDAAGDKRCADKK